MFSKKATKIYEIFTVVLTLTTLGQINSEDFFKFCGLLRIHKLYCKVQIFWEGTKFKTISHLFWNYFKKWKWEMFWNFCRLLTIAELYRNSSTTSDFFYVIVWLSGAEPSSHWGCCPRLTLRPQSDIIGALSTLHMWQKNLHSRLCFACCYISTLRFQISVHCIGEVWGFP